MARVDIKKILADPEKRKRLTDWTIEAMREIRDDVPHTVIDPEKEVDHDNDSV